MKSTIKSAYFVLLLLVLTMGARSSFGERRKLSPELAEKRSNLGALVTPQAPEELIDVIVQARPGASLDKHRKKMVSLGATHRTSLDIINGSLFRIPASMLPVLEQDPDIAYVTPDRKTIKLSQVDKALAATQANVVIQAGYTGNGIGVAVIDSGIRANHPDLQNLTTGYSRVVYSQSFILGLDANDQYGHGTHVAGIIAGNGQTSGSWMQGVASRVNLINLRVLDANGAGTDSAVIAAIQRAIQLKRTYNIRIINLSLGRRISESYTLDPLCQAVEQAWKAGIVVVVAAGNYGRDNSMNTDGYATITVPGNDPYVITVGATNTHQNTDISAGTMTSYSSKGPTLLDHVIKPDLVAPGNRMVSLAAPSSTLDKLSPADEISPQLYGGYGNTASYFFMSGTSMAAPMVSGTAALMLERYPSLTPDQVKARLMKTAYKSYPAFSDVVSSNGVEFDIQNDIFTVGAGYLNSYAAVASNDAPSGTALSPIAVQDTSGNILLKTDSTSVWSNSLVWGSSIVWGSSEVSANSIIWGGSSVWGDSSLNGYSILWGSSIIWGSNTTTSFSESIDSDEN